MNGFRIASARVLAERLEEHERLVAELNGIPALVPLIKVLVQNRDKEIGFFCDEKNYLGNGHGWGFRGDEHKINEAAQSLAYNLADCPALLDALRGDSERGEGGRLARMSALLELGPTWGKTRLIIVLEG